MNVSYEGIGYMAVTMPAGTAKVGQLCKLSTDGRADLCSAGEGFCGLVVSEGNQVVGVQMAGFAEANYTGTSPNRGFNKLSSDGNGGLKLDSNGTSYLVMDVNTVTRRIIVKL